MATPIAHKGVIAGAKVQAMTMLDLLLNPELVKNAWDYFNNVQTKEMKYKSFLRPDDKAADLAESENHGAVSGADEGVVLRSVEVRDVSWSSWGSSIRRFASDRAEWRRRKELLTAESHLKVH